MSKFAPTVEQQKIIDAFLTGEDLVIEAGAGTGKTSTLRLMAEATTEKGLYLAYNKAIQTDAAKEFPKNVLCKTAHSMAWGAIIAPSKAFKTRLSGPNNRGAQRVSSKQQVATLGIPNAGLKISEELSLPAWTIARLAMETVGSFCNSADETVAFKHVPHVEGVEDHAFLANYVLPFAVKAWKDITSPTGSLQYKHDHYLKMWALTNPVLNADFILFDEAQDANPVIAKIVQDQPCQKIMVGDRCQAIYGWRGAVDAMSNFEAKHRLVLSQSFRFGPAVAEQANKFLDLLEAPLRLSGFDKIASTVERLADPDAILCRTNAEAISQAMRFQAEGKRVAIVGGTRDIENFAYGCLDLMKERKATHPDLMAFDTWSEAVTYAKSDEGRDLRTMVNLVLTYGPPAIIEVCKNSATEASCDIVISTAHKAKGREWANVLIASDFNKSEESPELPSRPELMLMYVAVTRAKKTLDCSSLNWIDALIRAQAEETAVAV